MLSHGVQNSKSTISYMERKFTCIHTIFDTSKIIDIKNIKT